MLLLQFLGCKRWLTFNITQLYSADFNSPDVCLVFLIAFRFGICLIHGAGVREPFHQTVLHQHTCFLKNSLV